MLRGFEEGAQGQSGGLVAHLSPIDLARQMCRALRLARPTRRASAVLDSSRNRALTPISSTNGTALCRPGMTSLPCARG